MVFIMICCFLFEDQFAIANIIIGNHQSLCVLDVCMRVRVSVFTRTLILLCTRSSLHCVTGDEDFDNFRKKPFSDKHHHQFYVRSKFIHFIDFRAVLLLFLMPSSAKETRCWNACVCVRVFVEKLDENQCLNTHLFTPISYCSYLISPPLNDDVKKPIWLKIKTITVRGKFFDVKDMFYWHFGSQLRKRKTNQ